MGFLPNGDLILVSLMDHKVYLYRLTNKPKIDATLWRSSQTYDIEIPKDLNFDHVDWFVHLQWQCEEEKEKAERKRKKKRGNKVIHFNYY